MSKSIISFSIVAGAVLLVSRNNPNGSGLMRIRIIRHANSKRTYLKLMPFGTRGPLENGDAAAPRAWSRTPAIGAADAHATSAVMILQVRMKCILEEMARCGVCRRGCKQVSDRPLIYATDCARTGASSSTIDRRTESTPGAASAHNSQACLYTGQGIEISTQFVLRAERDLP